MTAAFEAAGESTPACACCPLDQVRTGATVRIRRLGTAPEVSQRLREIGFGEDQLIRLVAKSSNLICQVCNARLALSNAVAAQILVEPVLRPTFRV